MSDAMNRHLAALVDLLAEIAVEDYPRELEQDQPTDEVGKQLSCDRY